MKNVSKIYLLITLIYFSSIQIVNAQNPKIQEIAKKTHESLMKIKDLRFLIHTTKKPFSSKDTIKLKAYGLLHLNNNQPTSYYIVSKWSKDYTIEKFDNIHVSKTIFTADSLDYEKEINLYDLKNYSIENYKFLTQTNEILFKHNLNIFFSKKNVFNYYRKFYSTWFNDSVSIEENIFKNIPVYIITISENSENREDRITNYTSKYFIRKDNFLPIAYSFYGEFEAMYENVFTEIEYLEINPKLPLDFFKIDPTIKEVTPRAFYEEAKKYNL